MKEALAGDTLYMTIGQGDAVLAGPKPAPAPTLPSPPKRNSSSTASSPTRPKAADSALYGALGYTRKSDRKRGLTRKRAEPPVWQTP